MALTLALPLVPSSGGLPQFEVVSIKPADPHASRFPGWGWTGPLLPGGEYVSRAVTLEQLIGFAYPNAFQVDGLPAWAAGVRGADYFAVDAKPPRPERGVSGPSTEQVRLMMRQLLIDRFHLTLHFDRRTGPVYYLVVGKAGSKGMARAGPGQRPSPPFLIIEWTTAALFAHAVSMPELAHSLSTTFQRPVLDRTGLAGRYNINLPPVKDTPLPPGAIAPKSTDLVLQMLRQKLGLDLQAGTGAIRVLVVDHVGHPTPN